MNLDMKNFHNICGQGVSFALNQNSINSDSLILPGKNIKENVFIDPILRFFGTSVPAFIVFLFHLEDITHYN